MVGPDGRLVETPDERHHGQRMHDALEDVCDRMLRTDAAVPDSGGTPATVIITIDIEDLLTGTGYGLTSDGTLIRTDQVRTHGRSSRGLLRLPRPQRCRTEPRPDPTHRHPRPISRPLSPATPAAPFPDATEPPNGANDITSFLGSMADPPNLNNLTLLCRYHHHNFYTRGWTCRINPDGIPEWRPPPSVDRDQKPIINTRITALHAARTHRRQ